MFTLINLFRALIFGFIIGFFISIPIGPSGIESVKRTLSDGFKEGFTVSLGALCADLFYLLLINAGLSNLLSKNKSTENFFWIISGIILVIIGYNSIRKNSVKKTSKECKFRKNNDKRSLPFLTGFLITASNPATPSLWLFLSGTVIRAWYYVGKIYYYSFIFAIMAGAVAWFALLNYFALKGLKVLTPSVSNITSTLLMIGIIILGAGFILFGIARFFI